MPKKKTETKEEKKKVYKDHLIRTRLEDVKEEEATIQWHRKLGVSDGVEYHAVVYEVDDVRFNDTVVGYHRRDFNVGDKVLFRLRGADSFPVEMVKDVDYKVEE